MPPRFRLTSLLRVEERLLEAEYFAKRMAREHGEAVGYNLNAFLSAARSVTFLIQKEFSKIDGFAEWWARENAVLGNDPAARFFLELRNFSQKEGRISLVGLALHDHTGNRRPRWSHRFAGTSKAVPAVLLNRDIVDCCREHLAKLANVALRFSDHFPFHACPSRALTPEGVKALGIDIDEAFATLGLSSGVDSVCSQSHQQRIHQIARPACRRRGLRDDPAPLKIQTAASSHRAARWL